MRLRVTAMMAGLVLFSAAATLWGQTPEGARPDGEHLIPSLDGQALFVTYCAVCHGKSADGHGPMAPVLKIRVANLTEIAKRHGGRFPFEQVQKTIEGTESAGMGHGTKEMPIWGPIFSQVTTDQDFGKVRIFNLTKYLQTIQK
jgi:mono/diheme cytochrome c family protein